MSNPTYLVQQHTIEVAGYVRAYRTVDVYYDPETKEPLDMEFDEDWDIVRNDTDYYEQPKFIEGQEYWEKD